LVWSLCYLALRCLFQLVLLRPRPEDFKEWSESMSNWSGDSTGGKADDAATASAIFSVGFGTIPTLQPAMYGFEKRQRAPVCTFVE
jgi:hypothetical protein